MGSSEPYTSRFRINKYSVKESHRNDTDARLQPRSLQRQSSVTHVHVLFVMIIPIHFGFPGWIPAAFIPGRLLRFRGGRIGHFLFFLFLLLAVVSLFFFVVIPCDLLCRDKKKGKTCFQSPHLRLILPHGP